MAGPLNPITVRTETLGERFSVSDTFYFSTSRGISPQPTNELASCALEIV